MQKRVCVYSVAIILFLLCSCDFDIFNPFQATSYIGEPSPASTQTPSPVLMQTPTPAQTPSPTPAPTPGSDKDITAFSFPDADNTALTADVIAVMAGTDISATVPYGTDVTALVPAITITGVSVNPQGGTAQNFTNPVEYTVTAADSSEKVYTVTVSIAPVVSVLNARANTQLETGFITGTAAGGTGTIAEVEVSFDGGGYTAASGTISWKMAIPSGASTWKKGSQHTIDVRSRDNDGIYSAIVSITLRKATNKDVNGDGYADAGIGDSSYSTNTGRAYIYYGSGSGVSSSPAATITGEGADNYFGHTMTFGDLNSDGYADFIIGSQYQNPSNFWGKVHIFYGGSSGIASADASAADFILLSEADQYWSFSSALAAFDMNNDGYEDLAVGNYDKGTNARVHIFHGGASGISGTSPKRATSADNLITGNFIGSSIAFGDVNGDGYADIAIGALLHSSSTGRAYIVYGTSGGIPGGSVTGLPGTTIFTGEAIDNDLGRSVALGDIDGDGYADIAIGAGGYNSKQGRVYIYHGSSGGISSPADVYADADLVLEGVAGSKLGWQVAMRDVNNDGYMDLAISAYRYNSYQGQAFVYLGSGSGLITPPGKTYTGVSTDHLGYGIGFSDLNGDGYTDFIVGEPDLGRFFVYNGGASGTDGTASAIVEGEPGWSWFGSTMTLNAGPLW